MRRQILHTSRASLFFFAVVILLFSLFSLGAQTSPFSQGRKSPSASPFPENSEVRSRLNEWIHAPLSEVLSTSSRVYPLSTGSGFVKVRIEENSKAVYQLFLNQRDFIYPLASRGNVIIKRDRNDGSFMQMKLFLADGAESFLRIYPHQDRSILEVSLQGKTIAADIPLPLDFNQVLTVPLSTIRTLTGTRVPWELFDPLPSRQEDRRVEEIVNTLRRALPRLGDREDGAMNARGDYVYIENLVPQSGPPGFNCSGFAKWIIDGFAAPLTDTLLPLEPLKNKPLTVRGNSLTRRFEESRDPFFGLDWTRNLAAALTALRTLPASTTASPIQPASSAPPPSFRGISGESGTVAITRALADPALIEANDVRTVPYFSYTEDVGYPVSELPALFYLLARRNPGRLYLGSLNKPFGTDPPIRQHTHVALFFPYFDPLGRLQIAVMERNIETSLASLEDRYGFDFVHLVSLSTEGDFRLP